MKRKPVFMAVLIALLATGLASAQNKKGEAKLYRWVDKEGKIHYDQALPPEAVNQARREFNTQTGTATGSVDRALSDEERAAQAAAEKAAIAASAKANEQKRQEAIMMASYETEADMRRAYGERLSLLKMTVESTDISIKSLQENLATMLAQASNVELENRRVLPDRINVIRDLHIEQTKQEALQTNRRADLAALNAEFAYMLTRYRELRGATAAPAGAPAASPEPSGG